MTVNALQNGDVLNWKNSYSTDGLKSPIKEPEFIINGNASESAGDTVSVNQDKDNIEQKRAKVAEKMDALKNDKTMPWHKKFGQWLKICGECTNIQTLTEQQHWDNKLAHINP